MRDGDLDLDALGIDHDEFVKKESAELGFSVEEVLEDFIKSREAKA